ncbi:hypothetical protein F2Q70_00029748 [Brassica cretica]|uniref:Uncharacterized protein n=1 Tax=Brassica cretica TaxID=69181 RepID=A0A8S9FMJ2_BRACR|nr:hypothetical protein F2Q70_00029748 [Brassica cretica]
MRSEQIWNKETRERRGQITTTSRLRPPPPPHDHHHHYHPRLLGEGREGGRQRERERGREKQHRRERERESSTARVFGLREFSAKLHFRFVMRQKKGAAALFIGKGKGNPRFLSNGP